MQKDLPGYLSAVVMVLLLAVPAQAQPTGTAKPDQSADANLSHRLKKPAAVNSCAAYGPGFVKVEGTDTCVHIGGAISVGAGVSR